MFNSGILGVAIGLVLVFLLMSWISSGISELVDVALKRRAKNLEAAILDLLGPTLKRRFYRHPLIGGLYYQTGLHQKEQPLRLAEKRKPSYVSTRSFADTVISLAVDPYTELAEDIPEHEAGQELSIRVTRPQGIFPDPPFSVRIGQESFRITAVSDVDWTAKASSDTVPAPHREQAMALLVPRETPTVQQTVDRLVEGLPTLPGNLAAPIESWLRAEGTKVADLQTKLEGWFDEKMDRLSGWYKRKTQAILLLIGLGLALFLNVDSLIIARALWNDGTLRAAVVSTADDLVRSEASLCPDDVDVTSGAEQLECLKDQIGALEGLNLPMWWPGWNELKTDPRGFAGLDGFLTKLFGLLLTAGAVSLGAPFWFDLLNKFVNVRATGRPPERPTAAA
jgi:hypothetical protein